jgi:selenocysteine lyase/cysteine desulfurase
MAEPLSCQRALFEIPDEVAYLNAAYMGPLPRPVLAAGEEGLRLKARPWTIRSEDFFTGAEAFRQLAARLVGGDADGVAILPAVSYGVALAARNLPVRPGGRVLVVDDEFPSDVYAWRELVAERGGEIVTVRRPADDDWTTAIGQALERGVDVAVVPNCHWTDGTLVDLIRVGEAARAAGAALVVDATQSLGALPLDVARVRPDVLVCALYKWLLGPYSVAFAWLAPQHREGVPLEHSWIARAGSEDFSALARYTDELQPGARRFDVGERANFALLPAASAALELMLEWGPERVGAYAGDLAGRIAAGARTLGLRVPDDGLRAPHLLGLRLPHGAPADLAGRLAAAQVFVSVRGDAVRVSPHVYNTPADADRLLQVLAEAAGRVGTPDGVL